jgi:hypothetical protein
MARLALVYFLFLSNTLLFAAVDCQTLKEFWRKRVTKDFALNDFQNELPCPSKFAQTAAKALYDLYAVKLVGEKYHMENVFYWYVWEWLRKLTFKMNVTASLEDGKECPYDPLGKYPFPYEAAAVTHAEEKEGRFYAIFFDQSDISRVEVFAHEATHGRLGSRGEHETCKMGRNALPGYKVCDSEASAEWLIGGPNSQGAVVLRTFYHNSNYNELSKALIYRRMFDLASNFFNRMTPELKKQMMTEPPFGHAKLEYRERTDEEKQIDRDF